jgi:FMN phosphatase YigB (HAD superfamily)
MPLTLLLDLDDTLLNTNLQAFIPAYFQALTKELAPHIAPEKMFRALISGTNLMNQSEDFTRTLRDVFDADFYPQLGIAKGEIDAEIEKFYDETFPTLQGLTSPNPEAKPFVEWAFSKGFRIAIATDPLLPLKAAHHRLRWAGLDPHQFELVTAFEAFHFSKTHSAYYAEVLGRMGWQESPILMVGNDFERDILPAKKLGLAAYLVETEPASPSGPEADMRGTLHDLRLWLESTDLNSLKPSYQSAEAVLGTMLATPASINGLTEDLDDDAWKRKSSASDWTLTELICHLRDTEREIHHMQLKLFTKRDAPFIPRPDTGVWASQRDYLHEDGRSALSEFNEARRETIALLKNFLPADWERKARHAIFGPTTFLEVAGFMAEHDRLHIHQTWSLLKKIPK